MRGLPRGTAAQTRRSDCGQSPYTDSGFSRSNTDDNNNIDNNDNNNGGTNNSNSNNSNSIILQKLISMRFSDTANLLYTQIQDFGGFDSSRYLEFKGWVFHVHGEFSRNVESTNLSRNNHIIY